jgi:hypothetical protein
MSVLRKIVDQVRDKIRGTVVRPFAYVGSEWDRMAPRERRWVAGLTVAVVAVGLSLGVFLVFSSISDLEEGNANIREALGAIAKHRDEYLEVKARAQAQEARLGTDPPQLVADIEAAARAEEMQIAESNERPAAPAGKKWQQHDVDLKLRGVDLQALTQFLRRVETGSRPIFVTRLSLKRRYSENDKLDAEVTAVAFERVKEGAAARKKGDGKDDAKGKAGPRGTAAAGEDGP